MMPYLFCLAVDLAALACVCWLGWLVSRGASLWLVAVMGLVAVSTILPGRDIFTCPKCGNVAEVKVYKARFDATVGVQKAPGEKED